MTDEHVEPLLDRYRTGELNAADHARVAAHVASCAACRTALAELEVFSASVSRGYAAAREAAPVPDWARQREEILARTSAKPSRRRGWLSGWVPQAAAAALAVIAVGVLWRAEIKGPAEADRALAPAESPGAGRAIEASGDRPTDTRTEAADESADASRPSPVPGAGAALEPVAPSISRDRAERQEQERLGAREADLEPARERANADGADADKPVEERRQRPAPARPAAQEAPAELSAEQKAAANEAVGRAAQADTPAADRVGAFDEAAKIGPLDDASRFESQARSALGDRDALAAGRTYALWRDTLAAGETLTPERRAALHALADSLAALLAARP